MSLTQIMVKSYHALYPNCTINCIFKFEFGFKIVKFIMFYTHTYIYIVGKK